MAVFNKFCHMAGGDFASINKAMIALLPKKNEAIQLGDFRPISLIHSVAKLIAKVLSMRLGYVIDQLISPAQSALQKRKGIHD
uniref:Reverse transcriptase domain-containing protein n=1 Tax=Aegilops tauschii subsp. strangulata TaxID=200361 RepID=A0A452XEU4_AEGTS